MESAPRGYELPLRIEYGDGREATQTLVARHLYDDWVSFMHPAAPASLYRRSTAQMPALIRTEATDDANVHRCISTLQVGDLPAIDLDFDLANDEVDDELAEHIQDELSDARATIRFQRTAAGDAVVDYVRIDYPLEQVLDAMSERDPQRQALLDDAERHAAERQRIGDELIDAAVARAAARVAAGARSGARRAGSAVRKGASATGRGVRKAGSATAKGARTAATRTSAAARKAGGAASRGVRSAATRTRAAVTQRASRATAATKAKAKGLQTSAQRKLQQRREQAQRRRTLDRLSAKAKPVPKSAAAKPSPKAAAAKQMAKQKPAAAKPAAAGKQKPAPPSSKKAAAKQKPVAKQQKPTAKPKPAAAGKQGLPGAPGLPGLTAPGAGGGDVGMPGEGMPTAEAGVAPGGGGFAAGPVIWPSAAPDDVEPRSDIVAVTELPADFEPPLESAKAGTPGGEEELFEGGEEEEAAAVGDELASGEEFDYDDDEEYEDEEVEGLGETMRQGLFGYAPLVGGNEQHVSAAIRELALGSCCDQPHVYLSDLAVLRLQQH